MTERSPLAVPEPWDLIADGYTELNVPYFERYAADALRLAGLQVGERVLDVAAGPGTLSLLAAQAGAHVTALDFAPAMVAAGFRDVQVQEVLHGVEAPSMAFLFDRMVRSAAPVAVLAQKVGEARWRTLAPALLARMEARFGTGPQRLEMPALLGRATRPA